MMAAKVKPDSVSGMGPTLKVIADKLALQKTSDLVIEIEDDLESIDEPIYLSKRERNDRELLKSPMEDDVPSSSEGKIKRRGARGARRTYEGIVATLRAEGRAAISPVRWDPPCSRCVEDRIICWGHPNGELGKRKCFSCASGFCPEYVNPSAKRKIVLATGCRLGATASTKSTSACSPSIATTSSPVDRPAAPSALAIDADLMPVRPLLSTFSELDLQPSPPITGIKPTDVLEFTTALQVFHSTTEPRTKAFIALQVRRLAALVGIVNVDATIPELKGAI